MKNHFKNFVIASALLCAGVLHGQEPASIDLPEGIIKIVPFELVNSTFMIEYEGFNKTMDGSWSLGLGLTSGTNYEGDQFGVKGEVMKRFYLKGMSQHNPVSRRESYLRGVYAGAFMRGGYAEISDKFYYYNNVNGVGGEFDNIRTGIWAFPGVMIGASRTFWDILYLELHVGAGVRFSDLSNSDPRYLDQQYYREDINDIGYNGVAPNIGFKIGIGL
jgi:hypothetical protein